MKRITTTALCLLLGIIMVFVALVDVSGATADSWDYDDDDRQGWHSSKAHSHSHKHRHRHRHSHKQHRGYWVDDLDHGYDNYRDDEYNSRPIDIRPKSAAVWRNPPAPIEEPQRSSVPVEAIAGTGPCREYQTTARIGGREQQIYGLACRQEDGTWKFEPNQN